MRILLVGALSWNPERVRSLCERGHRLWGLWSRSMAWDQGPYPATDGCVQRVTLQDAARTIGEEGIECVYSLFQVYDPKLWGPAREGVEEDVWTMLRTLLIERSRGAFDAPIVRHWGFDVHNIDPEVARALDGHVFCNREKLGYWSTPVDQGGCGLDLFGDPDDADYLDGDRPKREFMNDRFAAPLSDADGEIHTVCIGRPFNIDYLEAARHGIHVHVYCNSVDDVYRALALDLSRRQARRGLELLGRYLHVHHPLQPLGAKWPELRRTKARWVEEFSRYDAAWSYIGNPLGWAPLDDRAVIPNRLGTYLLSGMPIITDVRPGFHRYEELRRIGVDVPLVDSGYEDLRARLEVEVRGREKRRNARERRHEYSFDAGIDSLLGSLQRARDRYFAKPHAERSRLAVHGPREIVRLETNRDAVAIAGGLLEASVRRRTLPRPEQLRLLVRGAWAQRRKLLAPRRARRLAGELGAQVECRGRATGQSRPR
jgi:hypothetical protein